MFALPLRPHVRPCMTMLVTAVILAITSRTLAGQPAPRLQGAARNVVLVVIDGLRWQEVFSGAERRLIGADGGVRDTTAILREFWRETPALRRQALLPFLWETVAREGQLWGNRERGSLADVTNPFRFSYPGYNELLTGTVDPRIDSNSYPPNPNETVFEWLARKEGFRGRVAAVATWGVFHNIFHQERAGFPVIAGWRQPFAGTEPPSARQAIINELYDTLVRVWDDNTFDAPMHLAAKELVRSTKPRLLFVGFGETDEWQHMGRYDLLLQSARRTDALLADLWHTLQAMPEYRGTTTLLMTADHGRGSAPEAWRTHGKDVDGAQHTWIAAIGAGIPSRGERSGGVQLSLAQLASTVAALLGEDWTARNPKAAPPIDVR